MGVLLAGAAFVWWWQKPEPLAEVAPRPTTCAPGPHVVRIALPTLVRGARQAEGPLSDDGCLRLRVTGEGGHLRWQAVELQLAGGERLLFEATFGDREPGVGYARVLESVYAPEPMPEDWQDRGFDVLTWFDAQGRTVRTFDPASRSITEERVTSAGAERHTVQLPEHNQEKFRPTSCPGTDAKMTSKSKSKSRQLASVGPEKGKPRGRAWSSLPHPNPTRRARNALPAQEPETPSVGTFDIGSESMSSPSGVYWYSSSPSMQRVRHSSSDNSSSGCVSKKPSR